MKKYRLKNLDCAHCANVIEEDLKKAPNVNFVVLNFATKTLIVDSKDIGVVEKVVKKTSPQVELEELKPSSGHDESEHTHWKGLYPVIVAVLLYSIGLIFRGQLHNLPFSWGEYLFFISAYLLSGGKILLNAAKNIVRGNVFDENFLMSVSTLGAIGIHELPEAVGVMLFYKVGEFFQDLAVDRSRDSIKKLIEIRPDFANLRINGKTKTVSPEEVRVGDIIVVRPGEKIPLDGEVIEGTSTVDTSPLTGEPIPRSVSPGSTVLAGTINQRGLLTIRVTRPYGESSVSKIMDLVERASARKSQTEKFITKFSRYYSPGVVGLALLIAIVPPAFFGQGWHEWIYRSLVLLVISCPCALVISIPLGYFGGIGGASRKGILVKGGIVLDNLTKVRCVIFDKTGTLTRGKFKVAKVWNVGNVTTDEVLRWAAIAEKHSNHPVATAILSAYRGEIDVEPDEFTEIPGLGIVAKFESHTVMVGNDRLLHEREIPHEKCDWEGTVVHVSLNDRYIGSIEIADEIKEEARKTVQELRKLGIKEVGMLTGDNEEIARRVSETLELDFYRAQLLPEDKVWVLESIKESNKEYLAFVGDGINDAPVIAAADVGIAMGALGSDAAIETADVVIMTDKLLKVPQAIQVSNKTRKIVWQNITLALVIKGLFIILGTIGLATMWEAVFADVGVALIAVFNATRLLRV